MVTSGQIALSFTTVLLSVLLSNHFSWIRVQRKLQTEYDWERYSNAEEWCDDFIRLLRELQVNYEYKNSLLNMDMWSSSGEVPGKDLDNYGIKVREQLANRPVLIFNLIGQRDNGEIGISDKAGGISMICGRLSDENIRRMGDEAPQKMDELKGPLYEDCETLIDEITDLRNEDLQEDFSE